MHKDSRDGDDRVTDQWLTLEAAAEQLGVSVHAVRRRLKKGAIVGRQVPTRYGPAWEVSLNGAVTLAQDSRDPDDDAPSPLRDSDDDRLAALIGLVERQQQQIVETRRRRGDVVGPRRAPGWRVDGRPRRAPGVAGA